MNSVKILLIPIILIFSINSYAYVIQGSSNVPVLDGNISAADAKAKEKAMLNALKNYFGKLHASQPDREIPDVTSEFFKFIRSYKIAERRYTDDTVTYTVLADVDDIALNDLMYFVENVVNTVVYNINGANYDTRLNEKITLAYKEFKFDTKHQSEFQANLMENAEKQARISAFRKSHSQYYMDMSILLEPTAEGQCTVLLTTETYSKTKIFKTLKTKSSTSAESDDQCINEAIALSLIKTLGFVRNRFIPLPSSEKIIQTLNMSAVNYENFATPKKLMEQLKTRSFINSYKIKGFAANKLQIDINTYISIEVLLKKLQSIEEEYGFSAYRDDSNNILLDFTN